MFQICSSLINFYSQYPRNKGKSEIHKHYHRENCNETCSFVAIQFLAIIFIFIKGRAINRGTAIIRGNTVVFMIRERTVKNIVQYLRWISVHFSRYHLPLG